jgi:hypothetical protein
LRDTLNSANVATGQSGSQVDPTDFHLTLMIYTWHLDDFHLTLMIYTWHLDDFHLTLMIYTWHLDDLHLAA